MKVRRTTLKTSRSTSQLDLKKLGSGTLLLMISSLTFFKEYHLKLRLVSPLALWVPVVLAKAALFNLLNDFMNLIKARFSLMMYL